MNEEFYFLIEGKRKGPYSISEIKNQKDLNIHRETSAWQVGSDDSWKNAIEYNSLGFLPSNTDGCLTILSIFSPKKISFII